MQRNKVDFYGARHMVHPVNSSCRSKLGFASAPCPFTPPPKDVKWVVAEVSHTCLNSPIRSGVCDCCGRFFHLRRGGAEARHRLLSQLLWQFIRDDETTVLSKAETCYWWITRFDLLPAGALLCFSFGFASCASVRVERNSAVIRSEHVFHFTFTSDANKSLTFL